MPELDDGNGMPGALTSMPDLTRSDKGART